MPCAIFDTFPCLPFGGAGPRAEMVIFACCVAHTLRDEYSAPIAFAFPPSVSDAILDVFDRCFGSLPSVPLPMAPVAEGNSVREFPTEIGRFCEFLDMVGVKRSICCTTI